MFQSPIYTDFLLILNPVVLNSLWNQGDANSFESRLFDGLYAETFTHIIPYHSRKRDHSLLAMLTLSCFFSHINGFVFLICWLFLWMSSAWGSVLCPFFSSLGLCRGSYPALWFTFHLYANNSQVYVSRSNCAPGLQTHTPLLEVSQESWPLPASPTPAFNLPFSLWPSCCSLNLSTYSHLKVFAPTVPSAWKTVPLIFAWLPHCSSGHLLWSHHLTQPLRQDHTSHSQCPYPAVFDHGTYPTWYDMACLFTFLFIVCPSPWIIKFTEVHMFSHSLM